MKLAAAWADGAESEIRSPVVDAFTIDLRDEASVSRGDAIDLAEAESA